VRDQDEFVARLKAEGEKHYHHQHPFHRRMHEGKLDQRELQCWVLNRFYYQTRLPIKDALIVAKSSDARFRRVWLQRIVEQDGAAEGEGGIEQWLRLAEGVGLDRERVRSFDEVVPAVRFACDAYVSLVREATLVEAVASSLTELFSPELMTDRVAAWEKHYSFIDPATLEYFRQRPPRARQGSGFSLEFVVAHARNAEERERCVAALTTKCRILIAMLDGIQAAAS
jgi:coenzyme PQQ biosynthesis protein C